MANLKNIVLTTACIAGLAVSNMSCTQKVAKDAAIGAIAVQAGGGANTKQTLRGAGAAVLTGWALEALFPETLPANQQYGNQQTPQNYDNIQPAKPYDPGQDYSGN